MSSGQEHAPDDVERRLVLVVGVGRSGTSVFTGILGQLGFRVPQPEVTANATNPKGFGEPRWVVDFHDRILRQIRVGVSDSRPVAWEKAAETAHDDDLFGELRSWLAVQFVGADRVVVKDPRTGWFLPLWKRCADDLGIHVSYVTMLRHPAEAVGSALKYYGTWRTGASRGTSWVNGMLETELATRPATRAFVRYDHLLEDWQQEIRRVGHQLGIPALAGVDREAWPQVDEFVDPTLNRTQEGWGDTGVPERVQGLCEETWKVLTTLAETGGDGEQNRAAADALRARYGEFYAEAEAIAQSSVIAAKPRKGQQKKAAPSTPRKKPAPTATAKRVSTGRPTLAVRVVRRVPPGVRRRVPVAWRRRARLLLSTSKARRRGR